MTDATKRSRRRALCHGDQGTAAVEYGLLTVIAVIVAGAVYAFVPALDFGLPEFAKFGLGQSEDGSGGSGGTTPVTGSGATLADEVSDDLGAPVTCPDYPAPVAGTEVTCTNTATSTSVVIRYTSATDYEVV